MAAERSRDGAAPPGAVAERGGDDPRRGERGAAGRRALLRDDHDRGPVGRRTLDHAVADGVAARRADPRRDGRVRGGRARRPAGAGRVGGAHGCGCLVGDDPVPRRRGGRRGRRAHPGPQDGVRGRARLRDPLPGGLRRAPVGRDRGGRRAVGARPGRSRGAPHPPPGEAVPDDRARHRGGLRSVRDRARRARGGRRGGRPRNARAAGAGDRARGSAGGVRRGGRMAPSRRGVRRAGRTSRGSRDDGAPQPDGRFRDRAGVGPGGPRVRREPLELRYGGSHTVGTVHARAWYDPNDERPRS